MMKHLGDITKIDGHKIDPVDVVTGGSPCQDLSIAKAGSRHGLSGERSGLFIEQIRIVKELRERDRDIGRSDWAIRPRYMVWENVVGALSSGTPKGEDFRIVLEETARIIDETAVIPRPPGGIWNHSGAIVADGWSIAWRIHDAQFWGVPQRRKRIALVADFAGHSAPEILFERKGLSRYSKQSGTERENNYADTERGIGESGQNKSRENIIVLENHPQDSRIKIKEDGVFQTMGARQGAEEAPHTLLILENNPSDSRLKISKGDVFQTLSARMGTGGHNTPMVVQAELPKIRRLTPLECERLQGFPDHWTQIGEWIDSKGRKHKDADSPRYKALGNSIALPFWFWLLRRISAQYERPATLGSLFDGIGGFPLCWERCNGKGTAIWASEIEEFPIAVTKFHFPEERTDGDE